MVDKIKCSGKTQPMMESFQCTTKQECLSSAVFSFGSWDHLKQSSRSGLVVSVFQIQQFHQSRNTKRGLGSSFGKVYTQVGQGWVSAVARYVCRWAALTSIVQDLVIVKLERYNTYVNCRTIRLQIIYPSLIKEIYSFKDNNSQCSSRKVMSFCNGKCV